MAPEMITGKEKQGTSMDWWALGIILYEITLGTLPFHNERAQTSNDVFRSIVNADLTFPKRHPLSRSAVDFIRQLLRKVREGGSPRGRGGGGGEGGRRGAKGGGRTHNLLALVI